MKKIRVLIVDDSALFVGEIAVLRLPHRQRSDIVRRHFLKQFERFRPFDPDFAHVRDVENAHALAYGLMFFDNSGIFDRHVISGKLMHLRTQCDV